MFEGEKMNNKKREGMSFISKIMIERMESQGYTITIIGDQKGELKC